jgi:MFS family permease
MTTNARAALARRWKTLAVLSLSLVIIGLDNRILNVALPTSQEEFDLSAAPLQWMVDAYLLVFAGLLLVFGALGDSPSRPRSAVRRWDLGRPRRGSVTGRDPSDNENGRETVDVY